MQKTSNNKKFINYENATKNILKDQTNHPILTV